MTGVDIFNGIKVYLDDSIPPGEIRQRPGGLAMHPATLAERRKEVVKG